MRQYCRYLLLQKTVILKKFYFEHRSIILQDKVTKTPCPRPVKTDAASTAGGEAMMWAGVPSMILMPIGLIVTYTLMFNGGKEIADATVTHHGLVEQRIVHSYNFARKVG